MSEKSKIMKQTVYVGEIVGKNKDGVLESLDTVLIKRVPSKKNPRIMGFLLEAGFPYEGIPMEYQYHYQYFKSGKEITNDFSDVVITSCEDLEDYAEKNDYHFLCTEFSFVDVLHDYMLASLSSSLEKVVEEDAKILQKSS